MERSWWIVLVLICNLAYGQINSGAIGNNRFLQRTNPQIDRAIADGGSSLDHPEIQRLARQMVDLGIYSNLVLWVHEGLVKERVSGSDVFVPTVYDISGQLYDANQTDTTRQPKVISTGYEFDGSNDLLTSLSVDLTSTSQTFMFYMLTNNTDNLLRFYNSTNQRIYGSWSTTPGNIQVEHNFTGGNRIYFSNNIISRNTYYHVCLVADLSNVNTAPILYINGVQQTLNLTTSSTGTFNGITANLLLGNRADVLRPLNGVLSDFRYFDTQLTATQIDAIFQETKAKYGY